MTNDMQPTTEASTELHFAKRYAELGEWQQMYTHLWNAMQAVPDDASVAWEYNVQVHEPSADTGVPGGDGFGWSSDPVDQIQSVLYDYNDVGVDYIELSPAARGDSDE